MSARLDHLVVAAATLAEGCAWLEDELGVPMEHGGRHESFGTHNALLRLGAESYLEVIAIDPEAPPPPRVRWFELDTPHMAQRLADGPALVHWVVSTSAAVVDAAGSAHGEAMALSRGSNRWTLTVPADGHLPMGGVLPSLIAWDTPPPAGALPDRGVDLHRLTLASPEPDLLRSRLARLGLRAPMVVATAESPSLTAVLRSPTGVRTV